MGIIIVCSAIVVLASGGSSDSGTGRSLTAAGPDEAATSTPSAGPDLALAPSPTPLPEASPTPEPPPPGPANVENLTGVGSGDRLIIAKASVSAPLSYKAVGSDGQMPDPEGEDDVAYYNFSAWPGYGGAPGKGGNAVFAGHVDSGRKACQYGTVPPPCAAVLWNLTKVGIGDTISVRVSGVTYNYEVVSSQSVSDKSDFAPIVAATAKESITIITCGGDFNPATRTYDHRQVVKANRVS